jgi:hypothetical protein
MKRFASGKLYLGVASGNPAATLNHHEHHITSAAQRAVRAPWRNREFGDLREVV